MHGLEDGHRDEPDGAAALEREASDVLGLGQPVGRHQLAVETHRGVEPGQQGPGGLGAAREGQRRLCSALFVHDDSDEPAAPSSGPDAAGEARHETSAIAAWTCSAVAAFAFARAAALRLWWASRFTFRSRPLVAWKRVSRHRGLDVFRGGGLRLREGRRTEAVVGQQIHLPQQAARRLEEGLHRRGLEEWQLRPRQVQQVGEVARQLVPREAVEVVAHHDALAQRRMHCHADAAPQLGLTDAQQSMKAMRYVFLFCRPATITAGPCITSLSQSSPAFSKAVAPSVPRSRTVVDVFAHQPRARQQPVHRRRRQHHVLGHLLRRQRLLDDELHRQLCVVLLDGHQQVLHLLRQRPRVAGVLSRLGLERLEAAPPVEPQPHAQRLLRQVEPGMQESSAAFTSSSRYSPFVPGSMRARSAMRPWRNSATSSLRFFVSSSTCRSFVSARKLGRKTK